MPLPAMLDLLLPAFYAPCQRLRRLPMFQRRHARLSAPRHLRLLCSIFRAGTTILAAADG